MTEGFEDLIVGVITTCLGNLLGKRVAATINSYLNPKLAVKDPNAYAAGLINLAGERSSNVILSRIEELLCGKIGLEKREWKSLDECISAARAKMISDTNPNP